MGLVLARMPDTWEEMVEEKDRVLHWSAEVLARVDDNITNEDTFLMNFDNSKIDAKVEKWVDNNKHYRLEGNVARILGDKPASDNCNALINAGVPKILEDIKARMRKDYQSAYSDLKKFTKRVDELGVAERKIHEAIKASEAESGSDVKKFQKKLGPLRQKVFDNLRTGEKMLFEDKRLKTAFTKKVYDIDHDNMEQCSKKFEKLLKEFDKCVQGK